MGCSVKWTVEEFLRITWRAVCLMFAVCWWTVCFMLLLVFIIKTLVLVMS